jgi:hypothetical protein
VGARIAAAVLALGCAVGLSSCTGSHLPSTDSTVTETITRTHIPSESAVPGATVASLAPNDAPAKGQVERKCPYIGSNFTDPTPNAADDEGNRVYRTTVITTMNPVGCRFYFWAPPYNAIADIVTVRYSTPTQAHDAMIATGNAGKATEAIPELVAGVPAVLFRTRFYGPDGEADWACAFAKGSVLVIVHTERRDSSYPAKQFASDIEPRI